MLDIANDIRSLSDFKRKTSELITRLKSTCSIGSAGSTAFRVEPTKSAEADLEALYLWVKGRAPHQGTPWFNRLEQAILSLDGEVILLV